MPMPMPMFNIVLLIALLLLAAADHATTRIALGRGLREGNPLMRALFDRLGVSLGLAVKTAVVAALAWLLRQDAAMIGVMAAVYAAIVANNILALIRQR